MAKKSRRSFVDRLIYILLNNLFRVLFLFYFRFRVWGSNRYPRSGAALICSNHQSHLDPILIANSCGSRYFSFVARESLFRVRYFGALLRILGAFPIDRERGLGGIKLTLQRLKRGDPVIIFPEGTRTPDGKLQPFKQGFCAIARRSKVPIVPVAINGAFEAWPKLQWVPRSTAVRLIVGNPIEYEEFKGLGDEELAQLVQDAVEQLQQEKA
jgi:1-acyl-sn-glycerol-3-phosphate acyltransferase